MFRQVSLPSAMPGKLYLHSMPGRDERIEQALEQIERQGITRVVSLANLEEINNKSPGYAEALKARKDGWQLESFPIPDFGVPGDRQAFVEFAKQIAGFLSSGESVLIHCGAGIGRTGTFATIVLVALGTSLKEAQEAVGEAGSHPETPEQCKLIEWCAQELSDA